MQTLRTWARTTALVAAGLVASFASTVFAADVTFRLEAHTVASVTLNRAQLLGGTTEGATPVTLAGLLQLPFVEAARMPAVLMLHGDAGAIANQVVWAEELNAMGIAVFTLDSFTARGAIATGASLMTMPFIMGGASRVVDAERALALLAKHPRIDPARIAVMGFSSGGRTALTAAQTRFASPFGTPGLGFAAYVALYPDCNVRLRDDDKVLRGPIRIFIGEADVVTAAAPCAAWAARIRAAGGDATTITFPGAYHGFDNVSSRGLIRVPGVPMTSRCNFEETASGALVNVDTGKPPSDGDACVSKGLIAGYDAAADSATKAAVKALLAETFGLQR